MLFGDKIEINKNYLLVGMAVMIVIVLVLVFIQAFEVKQLSNQLSKQIAATSISANNGQVDMTGWTENDKMMYEHHGTLPNKITGNSVNNNPSGMVGGC